jgi:hypothetical protein
VNADHLSCAAGLLEEAPLASARASSKPRSFLIVRGQSPSPSIMKRPSAKSGGRAWPETLSASTAYREAKGQPPPSGLDLGGLSWAPEFVRALWGTGVFDRPIVGSHTTTIGTWTLVRDPEGTLHRPSPCPSPSLRAQCARVPSTAVSAPPCCVLNRRVVAGGAGVWWLEM